MLGLFNSKPPSQARDEFIAFFIANSNHQEFEHHEGQENVQQQIRSAANPQKIGNHSQIGRRPYEVNAGKAYER